MGTYNQLGHLITFEGGEGAGKSTQAALLQSALHLSGIKNLLLTREPGGSKGAEHIRNILVSSHIQWDGIVEVLLHSAARRDHFFRSINPTLCVGGWVICDRFIDSTIAYQGGGYAVPIQKIKKLFSLTLENCKPDLTIILDIPPLMGLQRAQSFYENQKKMSSYEHMDITFHTKVREAFRTIAVCESSRCTVVDASKDIVTVCKEVWKIVTERLFKRAY